MPKSSLFGMPARYLATPPTLSDGDAVPLLVDINGALIVTSGGGGGIAWGDITGTLSDQTDLQSALNAKADLTTLNSRLSANQRTAINALTAGSTAADIVAALQAV